MTGDASQLLSETGQHLLKDRMPGLVARWRAGELANASCAALYFLIWQIAMHGPRFASRKDRLDPRPDPERWLEALSLVDGEVLSACLIGHLERYHFHRIIPAVPAALSAWLRGQWALDLTERIPPPRAVLAGQCRGRRPVTVIAAYPRMLRPVLSKVHGFDFFIHDLEHAYKFFHDPMMHAGQMGFSAAIGRALDHGCFSDCLADPEFSARFDYLVSDMNTHVVHSLQYFRAILIEHRLRLEGKRPDERMSAGAWREILELTAGLAALWGFEGTARQALANLIESRLTDADADAIERAMIAFGRSHPQPHGA